MSTKKRSPLLQYGKDVRRTNKAGKSYYVNVSKVKIGKEKGKPVYKQVTKRIAKTVWSTRKKVERGELTLDTYDDLIQARRAAKERQGTKTELREELQAKAKRYTGKEVPYWFAFNHSVITEIEKIMSANNWMTFTSYIGSLDIRNDKLLSLMDFINRVWIKYHAAFYDTPIDNKTKKRIKRLGGDSPSIQWKFRRFSKEVIEALRLKTKPHFDLDFTGTMFNDVDVDLDFDDELNDLYN